MIERGKGFELFQPGADRIRDVHLDWLDDYTPNAMAEAFKESADRIIALCGTQSGHPDRFFYPVAYLYRHYVELALKNIIDMGRELPDVTAPITNGVGHQLGLLWQDALAVLDVVFAGDDRELLKPIHKLISELDQVDPDGQCFRYYRNRKGEVNLKALPRVVSLEHLQEGMERVFQFLSGCEAGVGNALQYVREARHEGS